MADLEEHARAALRSVGVTEPEIADFEKRVDTPTRGLLLYGSRARGDYLDHSDFDVLRLARGDFHTYKVRRLSVSAYTAEQLAGASGTLFGTHLLRDGRVLFDPAGELAEALSRIAPATPDALLATVRRYSMILDLPASERSGHLPGLVRLTRYLLRTAVYARAMLQGKPCFSVRELAIRFDDPALTTLLASDPDLLAPASLALLDELTSRLVAIVGPLPHNRFGSLAAIATGMWDEDRNLAALAVRAGSEDEDDGDNLDYSDLPKVLL
jgi:hypothetical protein